MNLIARVRQALDGPINPTEFERSACALLQSRYPGLSAVEGGHDFGRDADIYFPFGPEDARSRGRLLATTGDPAANLRTGLRRMREEGISADLVVIACLQSVSATARATLDDICASYQIEPPHVYARDWFAARLVEEPAWRQRLLGVAGELAALLERPLEMLEQATAVPVLVGRNAELAELRERVASRVDIVVTGVPGIGKTRLMAELGRGVVFFEPAEVGVVVDELLLTRPDAVVVDNAHDRIGDLRILRRARQQENLSFAIIATTWPDRSDDVVAGLPGTSTLHVDLLARADMNLLVESVGVTGYRARAHVLEQADGRPGWALILCELFVKGQHFDIVSGAALLANVERFLRRATESESALDALACVAALGHLTDELLHRLAGELRITPAELVSLLKRLARNGLVEYSLGGWHLQPTIRAPLIARWFFTSPSARPWSTLQTAFRDRPLELASAAIAAAQVGSTAGRSAADSWARSLPDSSRWDTATFAAVSEYSTLDEATAQFAVDSARAELSGRLRSRPSEDISYDPIRDAAARQLVRAFRQWLLPGAVFGLLDLTVNDTRPRRQSLDPLRELAEAASRVDPDFGTEMRSRERLLESTLAWLAEAPDTERWMTAAAMLSAVFTIEVSGFWTDPGAPDTVTISRGVSSAAHLERLIDLWDRAAQIISAKDEPDRPRCPPEALAVLVDLAGEWMRLGSGFAPNDIELRDRQIEAGARGGRAILESLRSAVQETPGLAIRAQRLLDEKQCRGDSDDSLAPFRVDPDLRDLLGSRYAYQEEDIEAAQERETAAAETLARRLASLGPENGAKSFLELIRHTHLAGDKTAVSMVAEHMRPHIRDPVAWYVEASQRQISWLLRVALAECLAKTPTVLPDRALAGALDDPSLRVAVISAVLDRTDLDAAAEFVISGLGTDDAPFLAQLFIRETPSEILHRLLTHRVPEIASVAAASFAVGQGQGPPLPEQWRPAWQRAVRRMRVGHLDSYSSWRIGELLRHLAERDPDLFEQWFTQQLDEMIQRGFLCEPRPRGCQQNLGRLPRPHRERLARRCAGRPWIGGRSMLTYLIGPDHELAERLLDDRTITDDDLLNIIAGQRNKILEQIGPLLLDRGTPPELIAEVAGTTYYDSLGPESHEQILEYFENLAGRVPALRPVAEAGFAQQAMLRNEASA